MNRNEMLYLDSKVASGLKVGDKVKVVECCGFPCAGSSLLGQIGTIYKDDGLLGFAVTFYDYACNISHFNLEKVEAEKPECKFKPFDKVLVRDKDRQRWKPDMFSFYNKGETEYPYNTLTSMYRFCIPYEGNEHLVGKVE